jgi:hypothetical protein
MLLIDGGKNAIIVDSRAIWHAIYILSLHPRHTYNSIFTAVRQGLGLDMVFIGYLTLPLITAFYPE